ncbi:TolC family protein [Pelobacter seleniigenes]|uniref:TolC family protein n=1 Tax=Pelobacter seleniigenes TaxID=407188 RepID=UPI0006922F07|nr:TolC family protein [Pelobacter seleniigenes]
MKIRSVSKTCLRLLCALVLLLSVAPGGAARAAESVNLPLKVALGMAISNNLDLRVDALDSSLAAADMEGSQSIYDPVLSFSANHGQTFYTGETYGTKDTSSSLGLTQYLSTGGSVTASARAGYTKPVSDFPDDDWTDWYTSVGISIYQPLLKNFGRETMELNISLAEYDHKASLEDFRDSVSETVYSVIKAYNRLFTLRQVLDSKEDALNSARQLKENIQRQDAPGEQQDVEIANTEYAISQRLKELVDAERAIKDQEAKLRYLIGVADKTTLIPVDPPSREEPMETLDQAIELAQEQHAELKQLRLDLKANELRERVSKRKLLPNLGITASGGVRGLDDRFSDSVDQMGQGKGRWWSAGLQFSMPLGNTAAESDYRMKKLRTRQLQSRLTATEWKIRDYIEADMRALISARVQIQVTDKAVQSAQQRLDRYRASLARKTSTVQNLLDAESDLLYARNSQVAALEDFANAVALLWKDAGVLLEREDIHIETADPEDLTAEPRGFPSAEQAVATVSAATPEATPEQSAASARVAQQVTQAILKNAAEEQKEEHNKPSLEQEIKPAATGQSVAKAEPAVKAVAAQAPAAAVAYRLRIGEFIAAELPRVRRLIRAAGLQPQQAEGEPHSQFVIRLVLGDFSSLGPAKSALEQLAGSGADGFVLPHGVDGYRAYAGSFFDRAGAEREQQRLAAKGLTLSLEETRVKLPTTLVTVGPFSGQQAARQVVTALEKKGLRPTLQQAPSTTQ